MDGDDENAREQGRGQGDEAGESVQRGGAKAGKAQRGGAPLVGNSALGSVRRQELELGRPTGDGG